MTNEGHTHTHTHTHTHRVGPRRGASCRGPVRPAPPSARLCMSAMAVASNAGRPVESNARTTQSSLPSPPLATPTALPADDSCADEDVAMAAMASRVGAETWLGEERPSRDMPLGSTSSGTPPSLWSVVAARSMLTWSTYTSDADAYATKSWHRAS